LRRFAPWRIFLVDAALMDEQPGAIRQIDWRFAASPSSVPGYSAALMDAEPGAVRQLDWREAGFASSTSGFGAATHGLPLAAFASYLAAELNCEVVLIGVQPGGNALDAPLTPQVQAAVAEVVERFMELMGE
jgi:Ni,Fe-hydrogenase maturation factor